MTKIYILKKVKARSVCGTQILVKQVFEKVVNEYGRNKFCLPLPKIIINEKIINLNRGNVFIHPEIGKQFQLTGEEVKFKSKFRSRYFKKRKIT